MRFLLIILSKNPVFYWNLSGNLQENKDFHKKTLKNFAVLKNRCNFASAIGRLAQLVQSIWFTPRGSGVRIPQDPQREGSVLKKDTIFFVSLECEWPDFQDLRGINEK